MRAKYPKASARSDVYVDTKKHLRVSAGRSRKIIFGNDAAVDRTFREFWQDTTGGSLQSLAENIMLDIFDGIRVPQDFKMKLVFDDLETMAGNANFTKSCGRDRDGTYIPVASTFRIRVAFVGKGEDLWQIANTLVHEFAHVRQMVTRQLRCGPGFDFWEDQRFDNLEWEKRPWEIDAVRCESLLSPKHCRENGLPVGKPWNAKRCLSPDDRGLMADAIDGRNFDAPEIRK